MSNSDRFYHQYVSHSENTVAPPWAYQLLQRFELHRYDAIERHLPANNQVVLDIGCGSGSFLQRNIPRWQKAVGIDVVPALLEQARNHSPAKNVSYRTHNAGTDPLPFADGSFILVTSLATLQYLENLELVFSEVHRVLKPGGIFICEVPNFLVIWRRLQLLAGHFPHTSLFQQGWDGGVIHYFSYSKLQRFAQEQGFTIQTMECSGIFAHLRNTWPSLLGANIILVCQKN